MMLGLQTHRALWGPAQPRASPGEGSTARWHVMKGWTRGGVGEDRPFYKIKGKNIFRERRGVDAFSPWYTFPAPALQVGTTRPLHITTMPQATSLASSAASTHPQMGILATSKMGGMRKHPRAPGPQGCP